MGVLAPLNVDLGMVEVLSSVDAAARFGRVFTVYRILYLGPLQTTIAAVLREEQLIRPPVPISGLCENNNDAFPVAITLVSTFDLIRQVPPRGI